MGIHGKSSGRTNEQRWFETQDDDEDDDGQEEAATLMCNLFLSYRINS